MLRQAQQQQIVSPLVCGRASALPFAPATFDVIFCVNALHHFEQPQHFIAEARRLLRTGGALAIIGLDPHVGRDRWFLYDYFPGTYEIDLARFSSGGTILDWMSRAGFEHIEWGVAEHIVEQHGGQNVLQHPILQKQGTSQLALLTDEAYAAGMARLRTALQKAEDAGEDLVLPVDIWLTIVTGYVHESA
jgi:SAM-dependent methyltransferase